MADTQELDEPAAKTFGPYSVTRLLGEGGMGAVYEARHRELGKRVAIKTVRSQLPLSGEARARFVREGRAAAKVHHPNVVDVYDVGLEGETPYMVLEYLEGEDLARLLEREGALRPEQAADVLIPAIAGVAAAHDLGVIHRDLKPDNVFISRERGGPQPRVLDFGISKLLDEEPTTPFTKSSSLLGTPYYMSPEQASSSKNIDARSDQYSLGAVLYECVTGERPFDADTLYALIHKIVQGRFAPPRQVNSAVPQELERIILRAMSSNPADRFATTRAFGRALLRFSGERTRVLYQDELADDDSGKSSVPAGKPEPSSHRPSTTMGHVAPRRSSGSSTRFPTWFVLTALFLLASAALVVRWMRPGGTGSNTASAALAEKPHAVADLAPKSESTAKPQRPDLGAGARAKTVKKTISSRPAGATVRVGNKDVGKTPHVITLPVGGELNVELRARGYQPAEKTLKADGPAEVTVQLTPSPPTKAQPVQAQRSTESPLPSTRAEQYGLLKENPF